METVFCTPLYSFLGCIAKSAMDILAEQIVMRWVIVDSKEGRSVDRIWSAYVTPSSTALYWILTSVEKSRTV